MTARCLGRSSSLASVLMAVLALAAPAEAALAQLTLHLPGRALAIPLSSQAGNSLLSADALARALDATLEGPPGGSTRLRWDGGWVQFSADRRQVKTSGGATLLLSAPARRTGARLWLPVEAASIVARERYGADRVRWDAATGTVVVADTSAPDIRALRVGFHPDRTRVVLEAAAPVDWGVVAEGDGHLVVSLPGSTLDPAIQRRVYRSGLLRAVEPVQGPNGAQLRLTFAGPTDSARWFSLEGPFRIVVDLHRFVAPPDQKDGRPRAESAGVKHQEQGGGGSDGKRVAAHPAGASPGDPAPAGTPLSSADEKRISHASASGPALALATPPAAHAPPGGALPSSMPNGSAAAPRSAVPPVPVSAIPPAPQATSRTAMAPSGSPPVPTGEPVPKPVSPPTEDLASVRAEPPSKPLAGGPDGAGTAAPRVPPPAGPLTIVIDPGHGGKDTGAIGPHGLREKDVVLDIALRLRRLLVDRLSAQVILTRSDDTFIALEERTAIANRAHADFFLSIHLNAAPQSRATGVETYYISREPSDVSARASAARENLVLNLEGIPPREQDSLKAVLWDMAESLQVQESSAMAAMLLEDLGRGLRVETRGVKHGPFVVLMTAAMPSALVEVAFISNPGQEHRLQDEGYRSAIAAALSEGVERFAHRYQRRIGMQRARPGPS